MPSVLAPQCLGESQSPVLAADTLTIVTVTIAAPDQSPAFHRRQEFWPVPGFLAVRGN